MLKGRRLRNASVAFVHFNEHVRTADLLPVLAVVCDPQLGFGRNSLKAFLGVPSPRAPSCESVIPPKSPCSGGRPHASRPLDLWLTFYRFR